MKSIENLKDNEIEATKSEKTAEQILNFIAERHLGAGDKLPNELKLAKLFNVGRSAVREAVRTLTGRNILEVRQGAGTFLAEERLGISDDPLGFTFIADKQKLVLDLLEVRMAIEPRIAALAASNASKEDVEKMKIINIEIEEMMDRREKYTVKDLELHDQIAQSSKNVVVPNLLPILHKAISLFIDTTQNQLIKETRDTHRAIVAAIEKGDTFAASDAMTLHLIYNRDMMRRLFDR
ncbi:MAG: FadR family transcriptional regulator [Elusimicrobiota bacterium]|jgi:DNA-binding FadR family transcriptional regulator|nr:FadR family transcriptional regulator [Elusimicrobiota bacterium]